MSRRWRSSLSAALAAALALATVPGTGLAVDWPPSTDIVVGEVVTGGSGGSDEYIEVFNGGDLPVQLDGLELVYVTATGTTVTVKHRWSDRDLGPGKRLLLANADGLFASLADHTYSGGLSATGGSVVLRVTGGAVVDSLSWGNATSSFVEGSPGAAPPPGASLERRPGGSAGNARDTNDNAADSIVNLMPIPEGSAAVPGPTPEPSAAPTPDPTPRPTVEPTATPTAEPTSIPTAKPSAAPTAAPTLTPGPESTPGPTPMPTPGPTSTPVVTQPPSESTEIALVRGLAVGARVTVTGVVTAEPGRILGDRTAAIQDASGGIYVRLPDDYPLADLARGLIARVSGKLAAPYGNLELRPDAASSVVIIGERELPDPVVLDSATIDEGTEGLLAAITASIAQIDRRSNGVLAITVRDEQGDALVYLHKELGMKDAPVQLGQRITATGIVGQRASRSGVPDGHRLWPRDRSDIDLSLAEGEPGSTPQPDEDPAGGRSDDTGPGKAPKAGGTPGTQAPRSEDAPGTVPIRKALPGQVATISGTVTVTAGLLDSDGRRVTVQDQSGAMLVRYPAGVAPAGIGQRIRASGKVGTWYGGAQLEADEPPSRLGRSRATATILRRPPDASDEWRLVSVTVRIVDVARSGDTWRAEATMGAAGDLPIVGLTASGIPADDLEPGRSARIVGIVKRAHPSASDQRFAVAPRSRKDIELGGILEAGSGAEESAGQGGDGSARGADQGQQGPHASATLDSLTGMAGQVVRIGGRLERVEDRHLTLDDGTAQASVRLAQSVEPIEPALRVGEVLNVTGRVRERVSGRPEIVVRNAGDVRRAALLGDGSTSVTRDARSALLAAEVELPPGASSVRVGENGDGRLPTVPMVMVLVLVAAALPLLGTAAVLVWRPQVIQRHLPQARSRPGVESPVKPNGS